MQTIFEKKAFNALIPAGVFFLLLAAGPAAAEEVFLQNGDRISGDVVEADDETVTVETEGMGRVVIRRSFIQEQAPMDEHAVPEPPPPPTAPAPAETPQVKVEKPWTGSISGGINAREGNTSNQSASSRFNVSRKKGANELFLMGDFYFSAAEKKMTALKMLGGTRYDHYFDDSKRGWYGLGRFEADQDRFAEINQRLIPALGPGYAFFNGEDFKIKAELAAGFAQTNFRDETDSRFEAILVPRFFFESRIYGQSRFIQEVNVFSSLAAGGGTRVRSESTVEAPFFERLKIRLSVIDDYNSNPGIDADKNDIRLISSVAYYL